MLHWNRKENDKCKFIKNIHNTFKRKCIIQKYEKPYTIDEKLYKSQQIC